MFTFHAIEDFFYFVSTEPINHSKQNIILPHLNKTVRPLWGKGKPINRDVKLFISLNKSSSCNLNAENNIVMNDIYENGCTFIHRCKCIFNKNKIFSCEMQNGTQAATY